MNSIMNVGTLTKRMAGVAAVTASLFVLGSTLALAEHYAKSAADDNDQVARRVVRGPLLLAVEGQSGRVVVKSPNRG